MREKRIAEPFAMAADETKLFIGRSRAADAMWTRVAEVASTPWPVLIEGPTGTGKTYLAREIHRRSRVAEGPFVPLALTTVPTELRQSLLRGWTRGAFTGADSDREGALELASGGTLFLDELGHAPIALQQTLLTLIESPTVARLGARKSNPVSVRFLFATSTPLPRLVDEGAFLVELFHRVAGTTIKVPPLRERKDDIPELLHRFLAEALREIEHDRLPRLSASLMDVVTNAKWEGNLRQLQSVARHLASRARTVDALEVHDLPSDMVECDLPSVDRVRDILRRTGGNKSRAARELEISRTTLYRIIESDGSQCADLSHNSEHSDVSVNNPSRMFGNTTRMCDNDLRGSET